jgi:hypothetical protein
MLCDNLLVGPARPRCCGRHFFSSSTAILCALSAARTIVKIRRTALLALTAALIATLAACSSADPTATLPAGTPTPITVVGIFTPHVQKSSATETGDVGRSWGRMARWDARLGWSIELPERGEWQFVRATTPGSNEIIDARRLDGENVQFRVVRVELGSGRGEPGPGTADELLQGDYDCGSALRAVLNSGGVARSDRLPDVDLGGASAQVSKITVIEPPGSAGHTLVACVEAGGFLYMASGHAPEVDDEKDVLAMLSSLRVQADWPDGSVESRLIPADRRMRQAQGGFAGRNSLRPSFLQTRMTNGPTYRD